MAEINNPATLHTNPEDLNPHQFGNTNTLA